VQYIQIQESHATSRGSLPQEPLVSPCSCDDNVITWQPRRASSKSVTRAAVACRESSWTRPVCPRKSSSAPSPAGSSCRRRPGLERAGPRRLVSPAFWPALVSAMGRRDVQAHGPSPQAVLAHEERTDIVSRRHVAKAPRAGAQPNGIGAERGPNPRPAACLRHFDGDRVSGSRRLAGRLLSTRAIESCRRS